MSISDIQTILNPLTEKYFGKNNEFNMEDIYNEVFRLENIETKKIFKDLGKKYLLAQDTFHQFPEEDRSFLQTYSLICLLSYDIYIKKMILEQIIDGVNDEKKKET